MNEEEMLHELISMERHRYEAAIEPWVKRLCEIEAAKAPRPLLLTPDQAAKLTWIEEQP